MRPAMLLLVTLSLESMSACLNFTLSFALPVFSLGYRIVFCLPILFQSFFARKLLYCGDLWNSADFVLDISADAADNALGDSMLVHTTFCPQITVSLGSHAFGYRVTTPGGAVSFLKGDAMPTTTMTLDQWMQAVNALVERKYGLSTDDLPDCCYADWFEDGMLPSTAARKAIKNAGGDF